MILCICPLHDPLFSGPKNEDSSVVHSSYRKFQHLSFQFSVRVHSGLKRSFLFGSRLLLSVSSSPLHQQIFFACHFESPFLFPSSLSVQMLVEGQILTKSCCFEFALSSFLSNRRTEPSPYPGLINGRGSSGDLFSCFAILSLTFSLSLLPSFFTMQAGIFRFTSCVRSSSRI